MNLDSVAIAQLVLAMAGWSLVGYKIWHASKQSGNVSLRVLAVAIGGIAAGTTLQYCARGVDQLTGLPNTGRMLSNCATLVAACAGLVFLMQMSRADGDAVHRARRQWVLLALVLAAIVWLFLTTPPDPASSRADPRHASVVYSSPYVYLYLGYFGIALVNVGWWAYRCLRLVTGPALRLSLHLVVAASASGLGYAFFKLFYLVGKDLGITLPGAEQTTATPLYVLATALFSAAVIVPAARPALADLRRQLRWYRSYQRLYPLWLSLYRATPAIALSPRVGRLRNRCTVRNLDLHLYRRVIEIRDGQLALRGYHPIAVPTGVPEPGDAPGAEARALVAALDAKAAGRPPGRDPQPEPLAGGADLETEINWLERLASAFRELDVESRRR